jgi:nucleoid DNA-binding protein
MAMTKKELIDLIYANMGTSKNESRKLVESLFDII